MTELSRRQQATSLPFFIATLTLGWVFWIFAGAARDYFFLFDDFALIAAVRSVAFTQLFGSAPIGFYRPTGMAVVWAGARLFDWDTPAGYQTIALAVHAINALWCVAIARALRIDRVASLFAGVLFLLSPWATEGFLWISGTFDLAATMGVLASVWCALRLITDASGSDGDHADTRATPPRTPMHVRRILLSAGLVLTSLFAFFAKESAIVLPALVIVWGLVLARSPRRALTPLIIPVLCVVIPAAAYLFVRTRLIGLLSGAYGEFGTLWSQAAIGANLWSYARVFVLPPLPTEWTAATLFYRLLCVYPFFAAVGPALAWRGLRDRPRLLLGGAIAILVSVLPVAWIGLAPNNTFSSRFVYLPGAWFAILMAAAIGALLDRLRQRAPIARSVLTPVALLVICGYYAGSLAWTTHLWRRAARLSHAVMIQMEAHRARTNQALHIVNLPHVAVEGPWITKAYAFRYYKEGQGMPPVRADMMLIRLTADRIEAVMPLGPDPFSEYQPSEGRPEVDVTLELNARQR